MSVEGRGLSSSCRIRRVDGAAGDPYLQQHPMGYSLSVRPATHTCPPYDPVPHFSNALASIQSRFGRPSEAVYSVKLPMVTILSKPYSRLR